MALPSLLHAGGGLTAREDEILAAYLYNAAKFVEWPASAFESPRTSLTIGVLQDDAFAGLLESSLVGKLAQGRPLLVKRFAGVTAVVPTHILFVGQPAMAELPSVVNRLAGVPVLIAGKDDRLIAQGGILNFYIEEETIHFEICLARAEKHLLKLSSKLLRLARIVPEQ